MARPVRNGAVVAFVVNVLAILVVLLVHPVDVAIGLTAAFTAAGMTVVGLGCLLASRWRRLGAGLVVGSVLALVVEFLTLLLVGNIYIGS